MAAGELNEETLKALQSQSESETTPSDDPTTKDGDKSTEKIVKDDTLEFKPAEYKDVDPEKVHDSKSTDDKTDNKATDDDSELKTLDDQLTAAGYDLNDITKQMQENGTLSDELIADMKTKFDPAVVDTQLENIKLKIEANKNTQQTEYDTAQKAVTDMNTYIFDSVGGEEAFTKMSKVLSSKLSKTDLALIDAQLKSGNKLLVNEGMKAAVKAYNNSRGMGGKLMSGEPNNQSVETVPRITKDDFRAIMKSEKYKTDPVYAAKMDAARMATKDSDRKSYGPGQYYGHNQNGRYEL